MASADLKKPWRCFFAGLALCLAAGTAWGQGFSFNAWAIDDSHAKIAWDGSADRWKLERRVGTGRFEIFGVLPGSQTSLIDSLLRTDSLYTYRLTAFILQDSVIVGEKSLITHLEAPSIGGIVALSRETALVWWTGVDVYAREIELEVCGNPWQGFYFLGSADARQGWIIATGLLGKRNYRFRLVACSPVNRSPAGPEQSYRHSNPPVEWVFVPEGRFLRGGLKDDELPRREVSLSGYLISRGEITNQQYLRYCQEEKVHYPDAPHFKGMTDYLQRFHHYPVVNVSWHDAVGFCRWLSRKLNLPAAYNDSNCIIDYSGIHLPTEAEWERAAHLAGGDWPWGGQIPTGSLANFSPGGGTPSRGPCEIGSFPATSGGLWDLAGNVWEWCQDWYCPEGYHEPEDCNPCGPDSTLFKVVRGGSWADAAPLLRSTNRGKLSPEIQMSTVGFRVARRVPIKTIVVEDPAIAGGLSNHDE